MKENKIKSIYIFRATIDTDFEGRGNKKPYREIAVLKTQSLSTFARAIVTSFGFYFDHCYGFYDNFQNPFDSKEMYELFTDIPEDPNPGALGVTYIKVSKVFDKVGKKLRFLFDYGDTWLFTVELINIKSISGDVKYPKVLKSVGKAPEQYPSLEEDFEDEEEAIDDLLLTKSGELKKIVFTSKDKITDDAHQLVKALFNTEGALMTNDTILEDFLDFGGSGMSNEETREMFIERIAEEFGVVVPEILSGETWVWKVVDLIKKKQKNLLFSQKLNTRKRSIS